MHRSLLVISPGVRSVEIAPSRAPKASAKSDTPAKPPNAATGESAKLGNVAAMLRRPGGASLTEIVAATSWKRHTARGRISDAVSKLLEKDEQIWSRRTASENYYAIMKSS
jgi:hypothetical protein